jgi:predicted negative regulator of RcsB-dependent stress response
VDDYLSDKEQWEFVKGWLRENGPWIIAGIALAAAGVAGWRWWQDHRDQQALEASARFEQITASFARGDRTRALVLLGEMERESASSPYLDQAKLMAARSYVDQGELDKAAAELSAVIQHSKDKDLVLLTRARLARVQIAQGKPDMALATLDGVDPGAFAPRFHEVRGDALHAKGENAAALKEYRAARTADLTGAGGNELLDLKITDLLADAGTPATSPQPQAAAAK